MLYFNRSVFFIGRDIKV